MNVFQLFRPTFLTCELRQFFGAGITRFRFGGCPHLQVDRLAVCGPARKEVAAAKLGMDMSAIGSKARSASILVIEDGKEVLDALERTLGDAGYDVVSATDGESAIEIALDQQPDLMILDIGLPKKNGYAVARELRSRAFTSPILMLTGRDTVQDRVEGLDAGADDYLAKPFDYTELLARVRALLRRAALRAEEALLRVGDLTVNALSREVTRGERLITLTQKEYALLEYLVKHAGLAVTRDQISQHVWKQQFDATTNIVDVYVNYLRKKLDQPGEPSLVQTVRGVGYMLRAG